ncbi:hypothetical protein ACQ856_03450 [Mycolicibacterium psychrotolerans]|uniref:hypothetical protein n=1 Tax=Mycolicibacterium psychrotolerans TaxID=216929 RepID=UPI003D66A60C
MRTPIGRIHAEMTFTEIDGVPTGVAVGTAETVPLRDVRVTQTDEGERVTWKQSITKPLRLNLDFDVIAVGDFMHGHSRAGRLPKSTVTGERR